VSREDEPWCPCSIYGLKVVVKEGPLPRRIPIVVLSAHHHHMDGTKVESIPACHSYFKLINATVCEVDVETHQGWSGPGRGMANRLM
jgi:hypothetical protein